MCKEERTMLNQHRLKHCLKGWLVREGAWVASGDGGKDQWNKCKTQQRKFQHLGNPDRKVAYVFCLYLKHPQTISTLFLR